MKEKEYKEIDIIDDVNFDFWDMLKYLLKRGYFILLPTLLLGLLMLLQEIKSYNPLYRSTTQMYILTKNQTWM